MQARRLPVDSRAVSRFELEAQLGVLSILVIVGSGCAELAKPPVSRVAPPAPVPAAPTPKGSLVSAHASSGAPSGLVIDGDVAEWATLFEAPPRLRAQEQRASEAGGAHDAASRMEVALTPTGAVIAGQLSRDARGGVWLSLAFRSPELPVLGRWTNSHETAPADCQAPGDREHWSGRILTEDEVRACEQALAEGAALAEQWHARFRRRYLIDESGVRLVTPSGLEPIPGVRFAWKEWASGASFEASLPALALPLCAEAPLSSVALSATTRAGEAPSADAPSRSAWFELEPPIGFEPHADHRAFLFEKWDMVAWVNGPLAYHPGDPNTIERAGYAPQDEFPFTDRMRRRLYRSELVRKERNFGELTVGTIDGQGIAVWRGGQLLGTAEVDVRQWVERDGELFGVSWHRWTDTETWIDHASFEALAIRADGTFRLELVHAPPVPFMHWVGIEEVTPSEDLRTLVIRGGARIDPFEEWRTTVVTWTYDPRTRDWRPKLRHAPAPPAPP